MTSTAVAPAPSVDPLLLAVLAYLTARQRSTIADGDVPSLELQVLGHFTVRRGGAPVPVAGTKPRATLTLLGLHAGHIVTADTLIAVLWGDHPPRCASKAVQTHVSVLRRCLGDGVVLTQGSGWTLAHTATDVACFTRAVDAGRQALRIGDPHTAAEQFSQALHLWRGSPVLPDTPLGRAEATRWTEQFQSLIEDRTDALLACGRAAELVGTLELAVTDTPLRERRWAQLMLALYRAGRQADALAAYHRARVLLLDQLGVTPGPELSRLQAAILTHDPSLGEVIHPRPLKLVEPAA